MLCLKSDDLLTLKIGLTTFLVIIIQPIYSLVNTFLVIYSKIRKVILFVRGKRTINIRPPAFPQMCRQYARDR